MNQLGKCEMRNARVWRLVTDTGLDLDADYRTGALCKDSE